MQALRQTEENTANSRQLRTWQVELLSKVNKTSTSLSNIKKLQELEGYSKDGKYLQGKVFRVVQEGGTRYNRMKQRENSDCTSGETFW